MGAFDDLIPGKQKPSGVFDDLIPSAPQKSSVVRQLADVPVGLVGGVAGLINAGVGLGDIATGGKIGDAVNYAGDVADRVGLPAAIRPTQWQNQIQSFYTPEMQAAKAAAHQSAVDAESRAKAEGADWKGQIGASAIGALKGITQNPRSGIAAITENYGGMKAIAKGTEKVLARYLPEINAAVKEGAITQAQADARIADLAGKISPVMEGVLTMGQNAQQVREVKPDAEWGDYLLQVPAGAITGTIARGVGKIPGLENVETTMALNAMGAKPGITGNVASRAAKGILSEGVLQEVPQSAQEQAWQNLATGKPLQEGVGEQAVQGLVAGGALGGSAGALSTFARSPREAEPLPRASQTGGTGSMEGTKTTETGASVRDLVQAASSMEANRTESAHPAPTTISSAQEITQGATNGNQEATPSQATRPLLTPAGEATSRPSSPVGVSPEPINTLAAPEHVSAPVSTATTSPQTSQVEPAGVPTSTTEGVSSNFALTQEAVSPAPGPKEEPTAVSGASGITPAAGGNSAESEHEKDAAALATQAEKLRDLASRAIGKKRAGLTELANRMEEARDAIASRDGANLQNRDRSRAASVMQMTELARNPDYMRLGPSRTPDSGAPMVFAVGDDHSRIPEENFGNQDVAVMSDGQRVPFRYAVVDASQVEPSNFADGRVNPSFSAVSNGTMKALNNGRTAGLRASYELGTAGAYQAELTNDVANVGITPDAVRRVPNPILVRVYSESDNTNGMAAKSQAQGLGMSPGELAKQDALLFDSSILSLFRSGDVAGADNRDFVRAFVGKLQQSGQDVAGMMTDTGSLSPTGRSRIQAALMQAAYGDADLVAEMFDSIDTDIRAIGEALKAAAGQWANMRDSARIRAIDPQVDITDNLIGAVRLIQKSRRERYSLLDLVNQRDLETGEAVSDLTAEALRLFYTGPYLTRAVGKDRLTKDLVEYMAGAMQTSEDASLFGDRVTAYDVLQSIIGREVNAENHSRQPESGVAPRSRVDQEGTGGQRQRGAEGGQNPAVGSQAGAPERSGTSDEASSQSDGAEQPRLTLQGQRPEEISAVEAQDKARSAPASSTPAPEQSKSEERPANWRTALREARQVANSLGIPWRGKPLAKVVEEIDRRDAKTKEAETPENKAGEKPVDASTFVKSPDGSIDFGEITPEMASGMKRQAGKIRLREGNDAWGRVHIESRHGKDIIALGYSGVTEFVSDVARNFDAVYQGDGRTLILAKLDKPTGKINVVLELERNTGEGDFYDVKNATPTRSDQFKNKTTIWSKEKPLGDSIGPNGSSASADSLIPRELSGNFSLANEADEGKRGPYATESDREEAIDRLQKMARDTGMLHAETSIRDAAEFGSSEREIYEAIRNGKSSLDDLANVAVQRSNGLKQGSGQGNNDHLIPRPAAHNPSAERPSERPWEGDATPSGQSLDFSQANQAGERKSANTEDAGSELAYNRRNRLNRGLKWEDIADKNAALRVKEAVKAKIRPKPDYQAMVDGGMKPLVAHLVKQVYDSIAPSPQVRGNEASDADLRLYIDAVNRIMDGVETWANDPSAIQKWAASQAVVTGTMLGKQVELSSLGPAPILLDSVYPGGWKNFRAELMIAGGNRVLGALQPGYDEAKRAKRDIDKGWPGKLEAWQRQGYKIVHTANVAEIRPTNVDGRFYISIAKQSHEFFTDRGSAEKALAEMKPVLLIDKRGRVVSQHGGDEPAAEAARAAAKRSTGESTIQEQGRAVESAERVGPARRMEGEDVSSDKLKNTFGFKGVNFGNWMKGNAPAKVAERQLHLNHAYDSFLDLAEILGVPPKAMSLNGMLGIAIGAQGGGKALAHFVPGVNEINLTRTSGAGALAHEWGHALDHYFATLAGLDRRARPYLSEAVGAPRSAQDSPDLRQEIRDKFKAIVSAMSERAQTPEEANVARQTQLEKYQRQTNNWLSAIRKDLENSIPGSREDAAKQSAMAKFDQLAGRIRALDLGDGKVSVGRQTFLSSVVSDLRDEFKSVSGNVPSIDSMNALQANLDALQHVHDQIRSDARHQPVMVKTNYQLASTDRDSGKSKPYWSTKTEMFARAFDAFVVDTMADKADTNTYLAGIEAIAPEGEERKAIGGAFKSLIGELKTKEADDGNVVLYSLAGQQEDTDNHRAQLTGNARKSSAFAAVQASPADRAVFDMAAEGRSSAEILGFLSEESRNPFNRYLAKFLRSIGVSPSITIDSTSQWNFGEAKPGVRHAAAYDPKTDTVALFTPRDAERHVLHELIHAATLKAIAKGGPAATRMRSLFRHVQRSGELDNQYGMSNIDEFVAEAFSNPTFQQALRDVTAPSGSTLHNAWHWFVRTVARILGLKTAAHETALDRVLTVGEQLMRENSAPSMTAGDVRYSIVSLSRSGTKPRDAFVVDGSEDIAQLPPEIAARTQGRFLAKPIRLLNGRHVGPHRGFGFAHIDAEHGNEIPGDDPIKAAKYAVDVVRNTTRIYDTGRGRLILHSVGTPTGTALVELLDHGDFYSIVTVFNGRPEGKLVWSGRSLHLSSMGSGDMAGTAMTATPGQSKSPSARTDQLRDAETSSKQPLDTLADQNSIASIAEGKGTLNHEDPDIRFNVAATRLAPNGRPSNLNEYQWQQVRTPEFKAWFGDWERVAKRNALDSMSPVEVDYSAFGDRLADPDTFNEKAKAAYASIKKATNSIDGSEIHFVMTGYRKLLSHSADASTLEIIAGLKPMMERAIPIYSEPHTHSGKPNESTRAWHSYAARAVLDGNPVYVKLVVREDVFGRRTIDAFHDATVTPEKEVRAAGLRSSAPLSMQEETAWSDAPDKDKLRQWYGAVNPSSVSKVVDENGEPLVVYHGTKGDFNAFAYGDEIHVTADPSIASQYATAHRGHEGNANVMPVYASIYNPRLLDGAPVSNDFLSAKINGNDGFEIGNSGHFAALRPSQIKSATGNTGQFSPDNPDIRFSVENSGNETRPLPTNANAWQRAKAKAAALLSPERLDKLIYELQDKHIYLKRLRDHIRSINGVITDMNDAYLGEELYHSRLATRTKEFLENEEKPLLAAMRANGVSIQELETFLHARHAPEANAEMAKRNPNQAEIDAGQKSAEETVRTLEHQLQSAQANGFATTALEQALNDARGELANWNSAQAFRGTEEERLSLSGMSDQEAADVMSGLSPERRSTLDALSSRVDAINEGTLKVLEDYGLMSKEAIREWRQTYKHYIPLHRDEAHPDGISHPIGQGFSTKGDAAKRRTGSNAEVTNILSHVMMQRAASLRRGEKNHVMLKLYLMARQNPLKDVWTVGSVPTIDTIDKSTGYVKSVPDPQYRTRENVLMLRIDGKDVAITMNEHNPQALRMAQALKNLDVDDLHYIIPMVAKVTRWFAAMATQYNPIFGIINLIRDTQDAALNLSSTELAGKQKDVFRDQLKILRQVLRNGGRMPKTGPWADLHREFQKVGGTTGYTDLYLDPESRVKELEKTLQSFDQGKAKQAWHAVAEWLSDYNEAMENSTRLAAYKAALDHGMSKERAASLAKNLTVNFNRKGRQTRELGALYAFFNAAVQGTTRMLKTLKGPAGRKIIAGGVALGAMNALLGMAMMGGGSGEDDEWDKIPDFVKDRTIIIPLGKQDYVSIPLPLGFQLLPNIGRMAVETAVYKDKSAGKQFAKLINVMADAFNPLGGGSTPLEQMPFPTVVRPAVALMENKDWTGKSIYIENRDRLNPQPGFKRSKDSATPWAKGIAWVVNAATGGTDYTPGSVSWTPDQIDYVIQQLTGGVGREVSKTAATVSAPFTGEELPPYKMPLVGRLYGSTAGYSGQSEKFYENVTRANEAKNEIKGRLKDGIRVADYLRDNPQAMELAARGNAAEHRVSALRKMRHGVIQKDGVDKVAKVREINDRISDEMRMFNRSAERLQ